MSFISKLWKDRVSDYPNKRKLTKEDGTSEIVTVERAEGDVVVAGDAFNAENMNDLETRIQNGFNAVEQAQAELNEKMDADKIIIGTSLINFNSGIGYLPYNHYPEYEKEPICIAMMVGKQRYGMTVVPSNYKDGRIELYTNAAINGNLYVSYFIGLRK